MTYHDLDFETGCGTVTTPYPAPYGAPDELIEAARATHEARQEALSAIEAADTARDAARQAEADDKRLMMEAARKGNGYLPVAPGAHALADEADQQARQMASRAQSAYYRYSDLYKAIMADPERRTAWLARVLPDYDEAATQVRADFADLRNRAEHVARLGHLVYQLAGTPHASQQVVGVVGPSPITDSFMIAHINTMTTEPEWLPDARALLTDDADKADKDAA